MNHEIPFTLNFDLNTGRSKDAPAVSVRRASDMRGIYRDEPALEGLLKANPLMYEFYQLEFIPEKDPGDLRFGTTILYPGLVGDEYFMTKGHFHGVVDTGEVYYCLSGQGYMMLETMDGRNREVKLAPGDAIYCPKGWAHRSVNTGDTNLVMFFAFRADAGHDYATIETKGFRKLLINHNGQPTVVDNPKWIAMRS